MASIPCAAYKASSLHENMRRRTRTVSESSTDSVLSSSSRPSSPTRQMENAGKDSGNFMSVIPLFKKTNNWLWQKSQSQPDVRATGVPDTDSTASDTSDKLCSTRSSDTLVSPPQDVTSTSRQQVTSESTDPSIAPDLIHLSLKETEHRESAEAANAHDFFGVQRHLQDGGRRKGLIRQMSDPIAASMGHRYLPVSPLVVGDLVQPDMVRKVTKLRVDLPRGEVDGAPASPILSHLAARQAQPGHPHHDLLQQAIQESSQERSSGLGQLSSNVAKVDDL